MHFPFLFVTFGVVTQNYFSEQEKKTTMKNRLLFIDTETGGVNPSRHDLLSIGMVVWESEKILDKEEILIKGNFRRVTKEAIAINHIDLKSHNKIALDKEKAIEKLIKFVERNFKEKPVILAGHNVSFDIAFLKHLFEKQNIDYYKYFSHRHIDTTSILQYFGIKNNLSNAELLSFASSDKAFSNFGIHIEEEDRHTALADAFATAQLFTQLIHSQSGKISKRKRGRNKPTIGNLEVASNRVVN